MSTPETIDFYLSLGCERLGGLIREELQGAKETTGSIMAQKFRSLILERLPLFVEHDHTAAEVTTWLNDEKNFTIRTFKKLTVTRSTDFAGGRSFISIEPSAAAKKVDQVGIELWLADNARVDMYDVATSLCRLLFDARKPNDALLLATMLSSDLQTLRKRGYPGTWKALHF